MNASVPETGTRLYGAGVRPSRPLNCPPANRACVLALHLRTVNASVPETGTLRNGAITGLQQPVKLPASTHGNGERTGGIRNGAPRAGDAVGGLKDSAVPGEDQVIAAASDAGESFLRWRHRRCRNKQEIVEVRASSRKHRHAEGF